LRARYICLHCRFLRPQQGGAAGKRSGSEHCPAAGHNLLLLAPESNTRNRPPGPKSPASGKCAGVAHQMAESSSEDQFRVLQREIRESIRRNHPNPERIGCVEADKLAAMAHGALSTDDPAYSHVMECSPCYEQLMALTEQFQAQRAKLVPRRRRWPAFAAAAAALATVAAIWLLTRNPIIPEQQTSPDPSASVAENRPPSAFPELPVGVLNLESDSPTRSATPSQDRGLQRFARRRMNLMIYLPLGLEEGQYEIEVARPNGPALMRLSGTTRIENGLTTLRVQPDFTALEPGRYELRYRRPNGKWRESVFSLR